jgi:probable phosphoglycerate mutase
MQFPNGETFASAQIRIVNELETLVDTHSPKDTLACFSHADLIRLAIAYFIGTPLDLFQRIAISPASISTLHLGESGSRILNVNQTFSASTPSHMKH